MTEKQIRQAYNNLPIYSEMTPQQKKLYAELSCRELINSIMIYNGINAPYDKETDTLNEYLKEEKTNSLFYLPRERIIELIKEQQEDFKNAVVKTNVYTDFEGCTYNSCIWADD